jgi:hypothetical protein
MIRSGVVNQSQHDSFISKHDLLEMLRKLIAECESPKCDICIGLQIAVQKVRAI